MPSAISTDFSNGDLLSRFTDSGVWFLLVGGLLPYSPPVISWVRSQFALRWAFRQRCGTRRPSSP